MIIIELNRVRTIFCILGEMRLHTATTWSEIVAHVQARNEADTEWHTRQVLAFKREEY